MTLGFLTISSFAHEISSQDQKSLSWLALMARSHAIRTCSERPEYVSCRNEQIRALAETAATIPGLVGNNISPREFVSLVEKQATVVVGASTLDCRINVC